MVDVLQRLGAIEKVGHVHVTPFLPLAGGTISGALTVTGATTLSSVAATTVGISGALTVGGLATHSSRIDINTAGAESLRLITDASFIAWYNSTLSSRRGYMQGNAAGLIVNSETGTLDLRGISGVTINGTLRFLGFTPTLFVSDNSWVRASPNFFTTGIVGGDGGLSAKGGGSLGGYVAGYFAGSVGMTDTLAVTNQVTGWQMIGSRSSTGGGYTTSALWANPGGGLASVSLHCGGVAPMMGAVNGFGNQVFSRDASFNPTSGNYTAVGFLSDSSRRWKRNIADWPMRAAGAAVLGALDLVARLRPVTWESRFEDAEIPKGRRNDAWQRLNNFNRARGLPDYKLPAHDCVVHDCAGDGANRCCRYTDRNKARIGFIAEEVHEVIPSAIMFDDEFKPAGIDLVQMLAVALAAVKELGEQVAELRAAKG